MSLDATPSPNSRPRPVVLYGAFVAALGAFLGFAGLDDLMPKAIIAWVALGGAVITAAGAVLVQRLTTPLSAPQDARGVPMIPVDVAQAKVNEAAVASQLPTTTGTPVIPD